MKRGLFITRIYCLLFFQLLIFQISVGQTNTWDGSGGNNWTIASSWSLNAVPTAAHDVLINLGGTFTILDVPTTTILKLRVTNNTNVTLVCNTAASRTITVTSATVDAIDVDAGSTLQLQGIRNGAPANQYTLTLTTANTIGLEANIDGVLVVKRDGANLNTSGIFTRGGTNATIRFNGNSTYTHGVDGSLIPAAIWSSTSTCNITGLTNNTPSGLSQNFGHFTYESSGHAALINFSSALSSIAGNFTVKYAGQKSGSRTLNGLALSSNTSFTLNVGGNIIIDHASSEATWLIMTTGNANVTLNVAGNFLMSNTGFNSFCYFDYKYGSGTAMGTLVVNVAGNFTMTGGYFDMGFQASSYTVGTELRLTGNLSVSATSTIVTSGTNIINGKIIFNKAGTQTMFEGAAGVTAYVNYQVNSGSTTEFLSNFYLYDYINAIKSGNFTVLSGGILDMNTYILHGYNVASGRIDVVNTYTSFTLNSSAGIITANANGVHRIGFINGSVSAAIATRTFSSGANYTYDGIVLQNSGTFVTSPVANQVNNLTINNTAGVNNTGVTLEQAIAVASTCTFIQGVFTTTNTNLLTINDNAVVAGADYTYTSTKYVNGPIQKIGNEAFTFPVGKISHGCRPISISAPGVITDAFRAELIRGDAGALGPITAVGLARVSGCEYWYLDRQVGTSNVNVTLSWDGGSPCNAQSYTTDLPNLTVAHFKTTPAVSWDAHGNDGGYTGNAVSGTVTWNNVSVFSPFSLGSTVWFGNPLTVKFVDLKASEKSGNVFIEWSNASETNMEKYIVERSDDGGNFSEKGNLSARLNDSKKADYSLWDMNSLNRVYYYRIKAIENSGAVFYSAVVKVNLGKQNKDLVVYPNPVKEGQVTIATSGLEAGKYDIKILNMAGQKVMQSSFNHSGGAFSMKFDLPGEVKAGVYSIQVSGKEQRFIKTILVQ